MRIMAQKQHSIIEAGLHGMQPDYSAVDLLNRLRLLSCKDKNLCFTALKHHINLDMLKLAFYSLNRNASAGIDGVMWRDYQENLDDNLRCLLDKLKRDSFRFLPANRVYIPKADGGKRPLGICRVEDKIVQGALKLILEAIYEPVFSGQSYGFRPDTRAHDALDALYLGIKTRKINYILDADIVGCFDNIDHDLLIKILEIKIGDKRILCLVKRLLAAGVLDHQVLKKDTLGVIQGAVVSPVLANVYLDFVLDRFVKWWRNEQIGKGDIIFVRYADDFIVGFEYEEDAFKFHKYITDRFLCAGLRLNKKKSRILEFGRNARRNREANSQDKPETFDFLGFRHICGITYRTHYFKIIRHTIPKRVQKKISEIRTTLRKTVLAGHFDEAVIWLNQVLKGYYNYFAVHENSKVLSTFRYRILLILLKLLNRRSQRKSLTAEKFFDTIPPKIVTPSIKHPYPSERFYNRWKFLTYCRYLGMYSPKTVQGLY